MSRAQARQVMALWRAIVDRQVVDPADLEAVVAPLVRLGKGRGRATLPLTAVVSHEDYTAVHAANVATLAIALGDALGFAAAVLHDLGVAALLHDVGTLRVPSHLLNSPRRLTAEEVTLMRRHPIAGAEILVAVPALPKLAAIVAFEHHLQADGGGYPHVPSGWSINPASALVHIADVYDALRTDRPYRRALEPARILEIMHRDRGVGFDPRMLDTFFNAVLPRVDVIETSPTDVPSR